MAQTRHRRQPKNNCRKTPQERNPHNFVSLLNTHNFSCGGFSFNLRAACPSLAKIPTTFSCGYFKNRERLISRRLKTKNPQLKLWISEPSENAVARSFYFRFFSSFVRALKVRTYVAVSCSVNPPARNASVSCLSDSLPARFPIHRAFSTLMPSSALGSFPL